MGLQKETEVQRERNSFQDNGEFLLYMQRVAMVGSVVGVLLCWLVLYLVFI
ncbi:hypothetical protein [Bacillus cereus]|uniref:hypothetical protein n=1 Tax=Bacillus cereus TaxID=1396 RepID=UPI0015D4FFAE|nr:hypothetical protein [Bacillus cereus]